MLINNILMHLMDNNSFEKARKSRGGDSYKVKKTVIL